MKKNHHYVPQVYLKYFAAMNKKPHEDSFLWVFEGPSIPPYRKAPKNLCVEKYFYSLDDDELEPDHELFENHLNGIETSIARILRDLSRRKLPFKNPRQRIIFARFISYLNFRTAQAREHNRILLQNKVKSQFVDAINKAGGYREWVKTKPNLSDISERDFLNSFNKTKILPKKALSLSTMLQLSLKMIPFFTERNWAFFFPEDSKDSFVTSDHPVVLWNEDFGDDMVPGFTLDKTYFLFTINPKLCLVASYDSLERYMPASREFVIDVNRLIANKSHKYVFASNHDFSRLFGKKCPHQ